MEMSEAFEVVIVGGSYAGLSAAMSLGRSMRRVLIVDAGEPCNQQTPFAYNLIGFDGVSPSELAKNAKAQVLNYPTIRFLTDIVTAVDQKNNHFHVQTKNSTSIRA